MCDQEEDPPVWAWRAQDRRIKRFFCVNDVPTPMRDDNILISNLYLPGDCDFKLMRRYALHTYHKAVEITEEYNTNDDDEGRVAMRSVKDEEGDVGSESEDQEEGPAESAPMFEFPRKYPCVLIRTPYDKEKVNPDMRHPALFWVNNGYACFMQDCRGRFKSSGQFYKYVNEAEDGYDTVEWLARQPWCTGAICSFGVSYLGHVQTSMACLSPPHLAAMFVLKGGFFDAFTSGVRQGGALESRQWVWAMKNAPKAGRLDSDTVANIQRWMQEYPFKHGESPLRLKPEYEKYMFDFHDKNTYSDFWKVAGLSVLPFLDIYPDIPAVYLSGWYDIYARSSVEFFQALSMRGKKNVKLIMGPWLHTGSESHTAGEVDFGFDANLAANIDRNRFALVKKLFDYAVLRLEREKAKQTDGTPSRSTFRSKDVDNQYPVSFSEFPPCLYFRMGGGEGYRTSHGLMYHGGQWLASTQFPPSCVQDLVLSIKRGRLRKMSNESVAENVQRETDNAWVDGRVDPIALREEDRSDGREGADKCNFVEFEYDPQTPFPSIGGNVLPYKGLLMPGAYNQVERDDHVLCKCPGRRLASRHDTVVFRSNTLKYDIDVTGSVKVVLYVSSSCVDTDFTAMLVDEMPPNEDYPSGFEMNITHGIRRCAARVGDHVEKKELMIPGEVYRLTIEMYPTSNLFQSGHKIALYVSSSNYPHFDINCNTGVPASVSSRMEVAVNRVWLHPCLPSRVILPSIPYKKSPVNVATFVSVQLPTISTDPDPDNEDL